MNTANGAGGSEAFKPIAVRPASQSPTAFALRCLVDLQLLTIVRFLQPALAPLRGRVLDVGAGEAPWREWMPHAEYVGLDVESANEFGMKRQADVVYYDGGSFPFADASFDHVISVEVLEHVPDPVQFLSEIARVLRKGGTLILTVPWSARLHHVPHDYSRFSRFALRALLASSGHTNIEVAERGNDIAVIANKLIVLSMRLLRPRRPVAALWGWPLALAFLPLTLAFLVAAHLAIRNRWGSAEDPLGYAVVATRS